MPLLKQLLCYSCRSVLLTELSIVFLKWTLYWLIWPFQVYLVFVKSSLEDVTENEKTSIALSLMSVCWALASFSKNARRRNLHKLILTWLGVIFQFLWRIGYVKESLYHFLYFFRLLSIDDHLRWCCYILLHARRFSRKRHLIFFIFLVISSSRQGSRSLNCSLSKWFTALLSRKLPFFPSLRTSSTGSLTEAVLYSWDWYEGWMVSGLRVWLSFLIFITSCPLSVILYPWNVHLLWSQQGKSVDETGKELFSLDSSWQ